MRVKRLEVENFRSIEHLDMELTPVCALVARTMPVEQRARGA